MQITDAHFEVLCKEITGRAFLKTSKKELERLGMKYGPAKVLADFAKEVKEVKVRIIKTCLNV